MASKTLLTLESLKKFLSSGLKNFDRTLENVKVLSLGDGKCLVELKVTEDLTNKRGSLQGGFSTTLVDSISSYAAESHERGASFRDSVSTDIHMTYLKAATIGDEIVIDARVSKMGKRFAFCEVDIRNKKTNDLLIKGTHTLFLPQ